MLKSRVPVENMEAALDWWVPSTEGWQVGSGGGTRAGTGWGRCCAGG